MSCEVCSTFAYGIVHHNECVRVSRLECVYQMQTRDDYAQAGAASGCKVSR